MKKVDGILKCVSSYIKYLLCLMARLRSDYISVANTIQRYKFMLPW